jgi:DNA modification methylase
VTPYYADDWLTVYAGDNRDVLKTLEPESVHCVVTSPPYWGLRDYGTEGQLGLESTPEQYVENMVAVFREVRRVLRNDGTCWLNLGDSYAGSWGANGRGEGTNAPRSDLEAKHGINAPNRNVPGLKPKDLVGIPWRVAFALQAGGWYLRSDIIWSKPNPMPESVTDRPTKSHEYLFLLAKSERYYFDADAVREQSAPSSIARAGLFKTPSPKEQERDAAGFQPGLSGAYGTGRNIRSVWEIATQPYRESHFATFPPKLVEPCIKAGAPTLGVVLDPFAGSGTVGLVAQSLSRRAVLIDLNPEYIEQQLKRNAQTPLGLTA